MLRWQESVNQTFSHQTEVIARWRADPRLHNDPLDILPFYLQHPTCCCGQSSPTFGEESDNWWLLIIFVIFQISGSFLKVCLFQKFSWFLEQVSTLFPQQTHLAVIAKHLWKSCENIEWQLLVKLSLDVKLSRPICHKWLRCDRAIWKTCYKWLRYNRDLWKISQPHSRTFNGG